MNLTDSKKRDEITIKSIWKWSKAIGQAEPTSRLMPQPWTDGQDWMEEGKWNGKTIFVYYYFDADEITDDAEDLPFDMDHIYRVTDKNGIDIFNARIM